MTEFSKELAFAKDMAKQAGELMHQYYRGVDKNIERKSDDSPVTIADKAVNSLVIETIKKEFPENGVLGEEESWNEDRNALWVCDPIDGTIAYIIHVPTSMFSLALVVDGEPVLAVAYNPWTDELYSAGKGQGAYRNDQQIYVSDKKWAARTRLAGSSSGKGEPADTFRSELKKNKIHVSNFIGTVFKGCLIAEGSIDGRTFMHNGAHDVAAIKLIIEEAGGKVTDLDGNEQRYDRSVNGAVMSNGLIHNELLNLVKRSRE